MELSTISQLLLKQSRQSTADSLTKLIESGAIKPGAVLDAVVGRSVILNPQQQQSLSKIWQINPAMQTAPQPSAQTAPTQGNTPAAAKPQSLAALLLQPQLTAVELKLLNTQQWVVSNQNVASGQQLRVQVREDRQLQLLQPASSTAIDRQGENSHTQSPQNAVAALKSAHGQLDPPLGIYAKKNLPSTATLASGPTSTSQALNGRILDSTATNRVQPNQLKAAEIRHYLRHTLPYGQNVSLVIKQLQQVLTSAEKIAPELKSLALDPKIWRILEKLVAEVKTPQQLQQATAVKAALANSGVFAEAKQRSLATASPAAAQRSNPPLSPHSETNTGDVKLLLSQLLQLTFPAQNAAGAKPQSPQTQSPALLFQVLNQLQGLDSGGLDSGGRRSDGRHSDGQHSSSRQQAREFAATLKQQVHALARSALFKITGLQLQQLLQQSSELAPFNHGAIIEIPVKIAEQVLPLTLFIEEKPQRDQDQEEAAKNQGEKRDSTTRKHWRVFLEFDLEQQGKFASEINLIENRVQAKFWTENASLRQQAQQQLETLKQKMQASGIELDDIAIANSAPPKRNTALGYSLVNVTT